MKRKFTFLLMALLALTSFRSWGQTQTRTAYHGVTPSKDVKTEAVLSAVKAPANVASSDRAVRGDSQLTYCSSTTFSSAIGLNNTTTYIEWAAAFRPSMFTANDNYITSVDFYAFQAGNYTLKIYDGDAAASVPTNAIYEQNYNVTTTGTWVNLEVVNQIVAIDHTKALWVAIGNTDALHPAAYTSEVLSTTDCCMMYYDGEWLPINELGTFNLSPWMIVANTTSDEPAVTCDVISTFPYFNDFEDFTTNHYCWISIDNDGDGQDWITGTTQSGAFNGYNSSTGLVSKSYDYNGSSVSYDADNYLLSPEFELPAGYIVTLSWYAKSSYSGNPDWYEVMIAPNGSTDINDFVQIFGEDGPADWAQRTADISAYAGTTVRVVFHHQDAEQYWILIDNLGIETAFDCDPTITEFPYFNDFENFLNEKDCWIDIDNDGDGYGWFTDTEANWGTGLGVNNSNCLVSQSFENYVGARDADNYLLSPEFVLPAGKFVTLSWYERSQDAGYPDWYEVMVAPNGSTEISDFVSIYNGVAANPWTERTADLTEYAGTTVRVVFHHQSEDRYILNIDNVEVKVEVKLVYNITYDSNIQHGSITGPATAYAGQTVTLSATPATGYELGAWIVTNVTTSEPIAVVNNQFIMPESDVTVSARFMHNFFTVDFERGIPFGWTTIDADGDGNNWITGINVGHNSSNYVCSQSYDDYVGALTPDNYLVSPLVQLGGFISFWACAQDANYPNEHFGVAVSTGSNTDAADFTTISEWTMTAKGGNRQSGERGTRSQGTWCQYTVDLSEYSGRGYVAIRHFNCTDQYILNVDDINMCFTDETDSYSISYPEQEHVSVSGISEAFAGQTVYLSTTVDEGYVLDELIVKNANTQETITVFDNQFVMPESNVTVTATFGPVLTLTVNDGTQPNQYIPIYGYYCDASNQHNQFIIPAEQLADMNGGTISSMTFYLSSLAAGPWGRTWTVKLMETTETTISSLINVSSATSVYTGVLNGQSSTMEVPFSTPYAYNGGNLLVDFSYSGGSGSYKSASFYGISTTYNSSYYNYNTTNGGPQKFLPKTTFTYTNPNLHVITLNQPEGGEIAASAGAALPGTIITLTATPELGYEFGEWIVSPSTVTITGNTFEMPASDVTVTATFNEVTQYGIAFVGIDETLITVAATFGGETITEAPAGTEVTLEYSNLDEGYTIGNWTLNGEALAGNTFIMPAEAVEVGVVLNERPRFAVTIDEAITNGTITAEPSSEILGGTLVTLTITPETGYTLDVLTVTDAESNPVAVTNNQFTMPESNVTVTATFVHGITVYDGTNTNNQVPVYGSYADSDYKSQFIFPAEDLEAMAGGIINSMTFYASEEYVAIPGTWSVYVSEVENTTLSGLEDWANLDAVLEGATITISGHQMTVNFATPFLYNGGNLLIGFNETNSGSYINTNWYGVTQTTNTAYYWYNFYSVSEGSIQFLPKTTFRYTPVTPYTVNLHVNGVVSEEEVSSLPTPENIPAGMTFCGWTNSDIATYTTEAPSYVTKATADGEDFYAVFSYSEMGGATAWTKVTDFLELNDNDVVIIGAVQNGNSGYTMNEFSEMISSATCPALPATFSNDGTTITELHEGTTHFTVTKNPYNYGDIYLQGESGKNLSSFWIYNLNIPAGWEETVGDEYNDIITFDNGKLIISYNDDWDELYVILRNIDQYGGINMRFGVEQIQPGYYDAAYLYKQQGALATYYMTEVFVIDEATSLTEDMTKRNVIIADGASLNINANVTLNVAGACFNPSHDAAQLVVAEGGQLIHNNTGVLATMKKNITETDTRDSKWSDWYTISSPLAADETAFADVTNLIPSNVTDTDYDLYRLDEKYGIWENARVNEGVAFTTIDKGRGYLYARKDNAQLAFAGEINVASVECTLTNDAAHGFNLIGNPFAQNIKLTDVEAGTAELAEGFYVLTNQDTWGTEPSFGTIAPLQGFLVQATTTGTATISKPTAAPSKGERSEQNTNIEMIVSNSTYRDNAFAMFGEGIGLNKVNHRNAEAPMLYVPQDGEKFAIAFMDENTTVFPLNFKAMTTGNYSISLKATDDINTLVLVDNMTGVETNMLLEGSYSFIGSPADSDGRFTVKLSISHNNGQADSEHFVYQNGSELVVNGEGTLQIFDILGRVVVSEEVHGQTVNVGGLSTGAYIVRMTGNEVKTQKIIIR